MERGSRLGRRTRMSLAVGIVVVLAVAVVGSATAKPKASFEPETGHYSGSSSVEGKSFGEGAVVKDKGSTYTVELVVDVPAQCTDAALHAVIPTQLSYQVTVPLEGRSLSFKGNVPNRNGVIVANKNIGVTVDGHFTGDSALTATVKTKVSHEGSSPESTSCTVPSVTVKLKKG